MEKVDIDALTVEICDTSAFLERVRTEVGRHIVGQEALVDRLLIALLTNGHILVEGVPGLAKTLAVRILSEALGADFSRIQFTPDLLPADLIGTQIYNADTHEFTTRKGPVFANLILADEINRAPAKVQSGLLEAMQEHQSTIGGTRFPLPEPFLVMATQNPLELEGTYPLPEAQVDRFMLKTIVDYPSRDEEGMILDRMAHPDLAPKASAVASLDDVMAARPLVDRIHLAPQLRQYILDLVFATRIAGDQLSDRQDPAVLEEFAPLIECGASPRASIFLVLGAKAMAFIKQRGYVTPEDIRALAPDILAHRIVTSYEAEAESISRRELIIRILDRLAVP